MTDVIIDDLPIDRRIQRMVQMQFELSFTLAGENWLLDPKVDTTSAMQKEADELIESAGYVPWWVKADSKIDPENCKTEVVDLFHFLMQGCLQENARQGVTNEGLVEMTAIDLTVAYLACQKDPNQSIGRNDIQLVQRWLAMVLLNGVPQESLRLFWEMTERFGMGLDDLYNRYMAKNMLNRFRRIANYKGDKDLPPYVKMWDGVHEDNWHVLRYLDMFGGATEGLMEVLARIYQHYTGITVMELTEIDAVTHVYISNLQTAQE